MASARPSGLDVHGPASQRGTQAVEVAGRHLQVEKVWRGRDSAGGPRGTGRNTGCNSASNIWIEQDAMTNPGLVLLLLKLASTWF